MVKNNCRLTVELLNLAGGRKGTASGTAGRLFEPLDLFLRFYLFFSPAGFRTIAGRTPLVERAAKGSSEYRLGVGEGLKDRVFEALRICIEGFLSHAPNHLDPVTDLVSARANSFTLLYRLLFIMYAEDRGLLPYGSNRTYTDNRSLRRHREDVREVLDRVALHGKHADYPIGSTAIWDDLTSLFDLINGGHKTYGVPPYNGGLFNPDRHPFLVDKAVPDRYLARVIDQLGRAKDKEHPQAGLFRVDYRDLAIQHLGGIYEGLLELHPHYATEKMAVIRREGRVGGEERTQPAREDVPLGFEVVETYDPGQVYLLNNKGERRASGSYYTPNHIVDYTVEKTLSPICRRIDAELQREIAQLEDDIKGTRNACRQAIQEQLGKRVTEFDDRILALRVCDPGMGSGHFLIRACQYLAEEVATNPHAGDPDLAKLVGDESILTYWKRRIVERCIYGVDLNPVAVELAKLALWLETAAIDKPLTFLDHHLRCGNSLIGADIEEMGALPGEEAPGKGLYAYAALVQGRLPIMLKAVADIADMPSETVAQVKEKDRLYEKILGPARDPLLWAAYAWCSKFFMPKGEAVTQDQYQGLLNVLNEPPKLRKLMAQASMSAFIAAARAESVNAFHWQLEFPEVFFDATGLRDGGGFDAIVGNPPYDVLSDKETGHDLSPLKNFLQTQAIFGPSFRGKNNLYKLFVCQAMNLLAEGGRLGFITPMAILGDDQAAEIRRMLLTAGAFTSIDAFPQKDDPTRRVFPEAKLSTAVFTVTKTGDAAVRNAPFVSCVHPADRVEPDSPIVSLTSASIPAYDPRNLTIVSCSQADWDLAVRITSSGRMGRVEQFAEFFQGELNETNEKAKGTLKADRSVGPRALRAAGVCLYAVREPSQKTTGDLYVDVGRFLANKSKESKAYYFREARIGVQGNAPQNNFRRLIAAPIEPGTFCLYTINFIPESKATQSLQLFLGILNSKICEWYFRLGSTSAHANQYQLHNLPCPSFARAGTVADKKVLSEVMDTLGAWPPGSTRKTAAVDPERMIGDVCRILQPAMAVPPYGQSVRDTIVELVKRITAIEAARGEIARAARSALDPAGQPYQDLIDRILYHLAGLSEQEWRGLEDRLATML